MFVGSTANPKEVGASAAAATYDQHITTGRWSRVESAVTNVDLPQQVAGVGIVRSDDGTAGDEFLAMTVFSDDR